MPNKKRFKNRFKRSVKGENEISTNILLKVLASCINRTNNSKSILGTKTIVWSKGNNSCLGYADCMTNSRLYY